MGYSSIHPTHKSALYLPIFHILCLYLYHDLGHVKFSPNYSSRRKFSFYLIYPQSILILDVQFLGFSSLKANLFGAATAFAQMPLFWVWPVHSDWTRERMWHFNIPLLGSLTGLAVWVYASVNPDQTNIAPLSLYGMAFLIQLPIIAQPILLSYRTATLYGATEQAVGVSVAFAAMSIASIIAPQMYPTSDAPFYRPAFISSVAIVVLAMVTYCFLPYCLYREAQSRKVKTGHAMPLRAMEDAGMFSYHFLFIVQSATDKSTEQSQVTEVAHHAIHEVNLREEEMSQETKKAAGATHLEHREV